MTKETAAQEATPKDLVDFPGNSQSEVLVNQSEFGQFHRIEQMLGLERVERLHRSYVVVAGCGAVGGFALEALARAGVGKFRLIDCDVVKPSNINRQILASWDTVETKKVEAAAQRVRAIYPACEVETMDILINAESLPKVFDFPDRKPDLLIDAIDSLAPKVELLARTLELSIPVISSMGAALRTDPSQVRFGRLTDVTHCRLSAMLRKRIRRKGVNTDNIPCVYSTEPVREIQKTGQRNSLGGGGEPCGAILPPEFSEDDKRLHGRRRSTLGSLPTLTGIFGLIVAHEAIRMLADGSEEHGA